jgi:diguanylate cyclase (GGDEF)-like protein
MIMPIIHNQFLQIVIRICFTLGAVIYIIGVILWSNYTKKVIEKFEEQSLKDSMTDVFNRKGMEKIYKMLSKENSPFYVFMCDLDGMKKINDKYGHLEGDKYVAYTAKILADAVGKRGYVGRVGGDEFVVILEYLDMQQIQKSILSIKQHVHGIFLERNTGISIGCAVYPDDGTSLEDLIKVADKKMYKDKESAKLHS